LNSSDTDWTELCDDMELKFGFPGIAQFLVKEIEIFEITN
jgi:hypothetical protein